MHHLANYCSLAGYNHYMGTMSVNEMWTQIPCSHYKRVIKVVKRSGCQRSADRIWICCKVMEECLLLRCVGFITQWQECHQSLGLNAFFSEECHMAVHFSSIDTYNPGVSSMWDKYVTKYLEIIEMSNKMKWNEIIHPDLSAVSVSYEEQTLYTQLPVNTVDIEKKSTVNKNDSLSTKLIDKGHLAKNSVQTLG